MNPLMGVALSVAIVYHSIGIYRHYCWFQKRRVR